MHALKLRLIHDADLDVGFNTCSTTLELIDNEVKMLLTLSEDDVIHEVAAKVEVKLLTARELAHMFLVYLFDLFLLFLHISFKLIRVLPGGEITTFELALVPRELVDLLKHLF